MNNTNFEQSLIYLFIWYRFKWTYFTKDMHYWISWSGWFIKFQIDHLPRWSGWTIYLYKIWCSNLLFCSQGSYKGGKFNFSFKVGVNYPHEPPKVKCETTVYHPNIDLDGNVCLNILREDWKPVLTINSVIYGLQYLFLVI